MNLGELRDRYRLKLDDRGTPPLWSDDEADGDINLAYIEAVDRGLVIFDRTSFTVSTVATQAEYQLDPVIIRVKRAWLVGLAVVDGVTEDDIPLYEMTADEVYAWMNFDRFGSYATSPTVTFSSSSYGMTEDGAFIVVPTPSEARTIRLEVWRYPLVSLVDDNDTPEIPTIYHDKMLAWAMYLAYEKQDSDTKDAAKAKKCADDFERDFGPPKNAWQRRAQLENRTLRVRPSPF